MNLRQAQQAIDDAMADSFKVLFGTLVTALTSDAGHDEALRRFEAGLHIRDEAHARATAAVERIFPE